VGQPTWRSSLLDDPNAILSPEKRAEGQKRKKGTNLQKEKTLDGADIVRDGRLNAYNHHDRLLSSRACGR
jgi:hypothetical protein